MTKTASERRIVEVLRSVEERQRLRDLATFFIYCVSVKGFYTLPFFSPSDAIAVQSFEAMIHDEHLESLAPELYCIGSYCTMDGKLHASRHRFLPYRLLASCKSSTPERAKGRRPLIKRANAAVCDTVSR